MTCSRHCRKMAAESHHYESRATLRESADEFGEHDAKIQSMKIFLLSLFSCLLLMASLAESARALSPDGPARPAARINTVEHLLASLFALGIDNVRVEVDGDELPVMDGSASPFVELVRRAGRRRSEVPRRRVCPSRVLEIRDQDRFIRVSPADRLEIDYAIEFAHPEIGRQRLSVPSFDEAYFVEQIAPARTFGFADEVEVLRRNGLARGGNFDNAIVLDDRRILNADRLRFPDEFVRHKVLDLIGDLALLGGGLVARIEVERGGHALHHRMVRALAEEAETRGDRPAASAAAAMALGARA